MLSPCDPGNVFTCGFRFHTIALVLFHTGHASGNASLINIVTHSRLPASFRESDSNISWLHTGNGDSKGLDLIRKAA